MSTQEISIGVLGLPVSKDRKVLLSQRNQPNTPLVHGKWQVIGGGLEFGETPEQTLSREFQEEVQTSVEIIYPHPQVLTMIWKAEEVGKDEDSHLLLLIYLVSIGDQVPNCEDDPETAAVAWYTLDEVLDLPSLPNTNQIVLKAMETLEAEHYFDDTPPTVVQSTSS